MKGHQQSYLRPLNQRLTKRQKERRIERLWRREGWREYLKTMESKDE